MIDTGAFLKIFFIEVYIRVLSNLVDMITYDKHLQYHFYIRVRQIRLNGFDSR